MDFDPDSQEHRRSIGTDWAYFPLKGWMTVAPGVGINVLFGLLPVPSDAERWSDPSWVAEFDAKAEQAALEAILPAVKQESSPNATGGRL